MKRIRRLIDVIVAVSLVVSMLSGCSMLKDPLERAKDIYRDKPEEAIEIYDELLAEDMNNLDALDGLAKVYEKEDELDDLFDLLLESIENLDDYSDPDDVLAIVQDYVRDVDTDALSDKDKDKMIDALDDADGDYDILNDDSYERIMGFYRKLAQGVGVTVVAGSNNSDDTSTTDSRDDQKSSFDGTLKIGVTIYKYDDNYMSFVRRSIQDNASDNTEVIMLDSQNSQAVQNEQVDMLIAKGVNVLAVNLVDPQAADSIIAKVKGKNIPVVFFNKEPNGSVLDGYDQCWYVGTDQFDAGMVQGEVTARAWLAHPEWDKNGDGIMQYVLMKGEPGHPAAEARTEMSVNMINEMGIRTEEVALQTAMWDSVKAKELMDVWLSAYGDIIECVITNNDGMALGAVASLEAYGYFRDSMYMPVVGVDAIPDVLNKIEEGKMVGSVLNDHKSVGYAVVKASENVAVGMSPTEGTGFSMAPGKRIMVPYIPVTIGNVDEISKLYE